MILKYIHLHNFRNFADDIFTFNHVLTIVIGENARGKTNLLEAVYLVLNGFGFRESKEEELIAFGQREASVDSSFILDNTEEKIFQVLLSKRERTVNKVFAVDKTKRKFYQYLTDTTKAVLFSPELLAIISGPPDERRSYMNSILYLYDIDYKKRVINYENALRKRNKILEVYQHETTLKEELLFWNTYMEEQANYITKKRQVYVDYVNKHSQLDKKEFSVEYLKNEFTKKRLEEVYEQEKKYRKTLIGPQKDDLQIYQVRNGQKHNVHHFGSRSEQRLALVWLKCNEIRVHEDHMKSKPLLLLDDVFSELDTKNKKLVLDLVKEHQTILTTTESEILELTEQPKMLIKL